MVNKLIQFRGLFSSPSSSPSSSSSAPSYRRQIETKTGKFVIRMIDVIMVTAIDPDSATETKYESTRVGCGKGSDRHWIFPLISTWNMCVPTNNSDYVNFTVKTVFLTLAKPFGRWEHLRLPIIPHYPTLCSMMTNTSMAEMFAFSQRAKRQSET